MDVWDMDDVSELRLVVSLPRPPTAVGAEAPLPPPPATTRRHVRCSRGGGGWRRWQAAAPSLARRPAAG